MKEKFRWSRYLEILESTNDYGCNKLLAENYIDSFRPQYLYKYFSLPSKPKREKKRRLKQLCDEQLWMSNRTNLNDPFDLILTKLDFSKNLEYKNYFYDVIDSNVILCLTTDSKNLLMWSHYADSHRGFCVKFRVTGFGPVPIEYIGMPLDYTKLYKEFYDAKDRIVYQNDIQSRFSAYRIEPMQYYKQKCWSYEKEFRIIRKLKDEIQICDSTKNVTSKGCLYKTGELGLEIVEIICGLNCSDDDKKLLGDVCRRINVKRLNKRKTYNKQSLKNKDLLKSIKQKNPHLSKNDIFKLGVSSFRIIPDVELSQMKYDNNFKLKIEKCTLKNKEKDNE